MAAFAIDHVVIQTLDREAFVAAVAEGSGLPILQGYAPQGVAQSSGVRFANGPFLDVFGTPEPGTALILGGGGVEAAERLASERGWRVRLLRRTEQPPEAPDFPWDMALFRRDQGLLTRISIIEYADDPEAWARPDFSGGLYQPAPQGPARLARVWLATREIERARADLAAFGYDGGAEATSAFWPHRGLSLTGPACEIVLVEGPEAVVRLDISTGDGAPRELRPAGAPALVFDEA